MQALLLVTAVRLSAALIDGVENVRGFGVVKQQRLRDYYKNIDIKLERYLAT
ncbi:MAG: hypothetical protein VX149_05145 [Pseudomonadota bacterium]|nr:hypothetical protein [Pseudomonadota bacterium]